MRAGALGLAILLAACTGDEAAADLRSQPAYRGAEVIRPMFSFEGEYYEVGTSGDACPFWLTTFGTEDPIEEVVAWYEGEGFEVLGNAGVIDGRLVRWIGDRRSGRTAYRRVDIYRGSVGGNDEWPTAFELYAPDCSTA